MVRLVLPRVIAPALYPWMPSHSFSLSVWWLAHIGTRVLEHLTLFYPSYAFLMDLFICSIYHIPHISIWRAESALIAQGAFNDPTVYANFPIMWRGFAQQTARFETPIPTLTSVNAYVSSGSVWERLYLTNPWHCALWVNGEGI